MFKQIHLNAKLFLSLVIGGLGLSCVCCQANEKSTEASKFSFEQGQVTRKTSFGGIQFSLVSQTYPSLNTASTVRRESTSFQPEISLFTIGQNEQALVLANLEQSSKNRKHNRYKNTIPTVYRLTLKGYSVMEYANYTTQTWSLDRVKEKDLRKPEIMFSFSKRF